MAYKYQPPSETSPTVTRRDIQIEFSRWNDQAGETVIRDYDLPFANISGIEAEVVFQLRGEKRRVRVSAWTDFNTNFRCCYLIIRDMRLAEARGLTAAIREAYGLIEAPKTRDPWEILGLRPDASIEDVEIMYKAKANRLHPDKGGTNAAFVELNQAYERIKAALR